MSIKPWDPGTGPPLPGPAGLLQWLRRVRRTANPPRGGTDRPSGVPDVRRGAEAPLPGTGGPPGPASSAVPPVVADIDGRVRVRPAAVLFDMDGLLVDSEPMWTIAERELAERHGGQFTPEIKAAMIGKRLEASIPIMLAMLGVTDADPSVEGEWLLARTAELFEQRLPPRPGAPELLDALAAAGVSAALVSSCYRRLVDAALGSLERARFAVTLAGDEVTEAKPNPQPYRIAAARLGLPPSACVVVEDSETGARSGVAAGCPTVLVPTFPPAEPIPGVTVVDSLHDVTLELLADLATPRPSWP